MISRQSLSALFLCFLSFEEKVVVLLFQQSALTDDFCIHHFLFDLCNRFYINFYIGNKFRLKVIYFA